jgi:hypothetical protein
VIDIACFLSCGFNKRKSLSQKENTAKFQNLCGEFSAGNLEKEFAYEKHEIYEKRKILFFIFVFLAYFAGNSFIKNSRFIEP